MNDTEKKRCLLDAAVGILTSAPRKRLNTVKLNKALFYLDLYALRDFGETITKNTFIALPMGPVVAKYDTRLIKTLEAEGLAEQTVVGKAKPIQLLENISTPDFSPEIWQLIKDAVNLCKDRTASGVSNYSHDNIGWQVAYRTGLGANSAAKPIDMMLAMQQVIDDDPWIDEPFDQTTLQRAKENPYGWETW